ncbi:MAG: Gfo/Idh/MocA family oxidoreductase [Phycisphaerae bacterium]|nr:Gfo/Idh/MocA family oxidoreductase [Phycisphaerae bacterium]
MVGVGGFGGTRRREMRQSGLYRLAACHDVNRENALLCQKEDGAAIVENYEQLLDFPGLEAIIISTGAKFHAEQTIAAARRGLHVFVEKPLCSTPQEVTDMMRTWRETGVVIGVGHANHSALAHSRTVKRMLDDGTIGTPASFEATTAHSGGLIIKPGDWRGDPEKNPGGMLFQCGVHLLHELMYYFGPVSRVFAQMRYDLHTTQTADIANCIVTFASGLTGSLNAYHVTPYRHTLNIFGMRTNLYVNSHAPEGQRLLMQSLPPRLDGSVEPVVPVQLEAEMPLGNLRSFHQAVRKKTLPYPSILDGARAVGVVFAAEESARLGKPVDVPREWMYQD